MSKKAVVLLSGGLDSTTTLAIALSLGFDVHTLSFAYGQRHAHELDAVSRVVEHMGVASHRLITIDLRQFGHSALTADIDVPKGGDTASSIPITYVPARNTIFLSYALAYAEVLASHDIFIGVNALDYSGYPDCRPEYIASFEAMANLATAAGVQSSHKLNIHAPLIQMTKAEIIQTGLKLGVDYSLTLSCYDPNDQGHACGSCASCDLRKKGFSENGWVDPAPYQAEGVDYAAG
jgi:7-cyano-7-deazaguanine synthase